MPELSLSLILAVIILGGWLCARLFGFLRLPPIMGMVVFGILCSIFLRPGTPGALLDLDPFLKSFALMVILLRAGLGISKATLKKVGLTALWMAFVPCIMEGAALTVLFYHLFGFSWAVSGLTGFMLAAVSPAVIVPSMLDLKSRGHGAKNDVPTIVLAGASVDDVFAITIFSVFLTLARSAVPADAAMDIGSAGVESVAAMMLRAALSVPLSIAAGIGSGLVLGFVLSFLFKRHFTSIRATEKTLLLLVCGTLLVQVGDALHFAALLGLMTAGFVLLERHERAAHELASKLGKIWIFAEILLFVLIGFSLDVTVALAAGFRGLGVIALGLVFRSVGVLLALSGSELSLRERLFCVVAYTPKATVQAALGGVALAAGIAEGPVILALAVLAILFTAPLGLIGIRLLGPRLLAE